MLRALDAAASGMQAQELRTEVIANNLANVSTTGFKRQRAEFQDLMYYTPSARLALPTRPAIRCLPVFKSAMAYAQSRRCASSTMVRCSRQTTRSTSLSEATAFLREPTEWRDGLHA